MLQRHRGILLDQQNGDAELLPDAARARRSDLRTTTGARPSDSSSTSSSSGSQTSARPSASICRSPPDSNPGAPPVAAPPAPERTGRRGLRGRGARAALPRDDAPLRFSATVRLGKTFRAPAPAQCRAAVLAMRLLILDAACRRSGCCRRDAGVVEADETRDGAQVVVLPAPLLPRSATICLRARRAARRHASRSPRRGDRRPPARRHQEAARSSATASCRRTGRCFSGREGNILHPLPDADQPWRLEQQKQDHHHAECGVVEGEHHIAEARGQVAGDRLRWRKETA